MCVFTNLLPSEHQRKTSADSTRNELWQWLEEGYRQLMLGVLCSRISQQGPAPSHAPAVPDTLAIQDAAEEKLGRRSNSLHDQGREVHGQHTSHPPTRVIEVYVFNVILLSLMSPKLCSFSVSLSFLSWHGGWYTWG